MLGSFIEGGGRNSRGIEEFGISRNVFFVVGGVIFRFDSNRCQRCLEMFGDSEMKEDDEYRN